MRLTSKAILPVALLAAGLFAGCTGGTSKPAAGPVEKTPDDLKPVPPTPVATPAAPALHEGFDWAPYVAKPGVRGVWITNVDSDLLASREKIAEAMDALAAANINVVYPVVWNQGKTLWRSEVIKKYFAGKHPATPAPNADWDRIRKAQDLGIDPIYGDRDPLAEIIVEAHRVGIEVVPWFEFGFSSSYNMGGGPILEVYPQWAAIGPDGQLVKKNNFEWMNAFDPEVQLFLNELIMEVVHNYDVDGIQGDDRLPALPTLGGYDEKTIARYKAETGKEPPRGDVKDKEWVKWRADILTEYLRGLHDQVKGVDENLTVSMSPSYWDWALYEYLQDSKTWVEKGLVDSLHPQAYRYDFPAYMKVVDDIVINQFAPDNLSLFAPGVLISLGKYRITKDYFLDAIAYNRSRGVNGEVFFFYEGLRKENDELLKSLSAPYAQKVPLPYRNTTSPWRPEPAIFEAKTAKLIGEWVPCPAGAEYIQKVGGTNARLVYSAKVPVDGKYDVYMKLPAGDPKYSKQAYFVIPNIQLDMSAPASLRQAPQLPKGMAPMQVKYVDQTTGPERWVHLATTDVKAGINYGAVSLLTNESNDSTITVGGPIMLLLNRKEMRAPAGK